MVPLSLVVVLVLVLGLVGCEDDQPATDRGSATSSPTTGPDPAPEGSPFTVDSLRVTFDLPSSFQEAEEPSLLFLARSDDRAAIFSIDEDASDVVEHEPEPGESVAPVDVGAGDAVVVTAAALQGLPPGVSANELLVSNGSRSFAAIMSAEETELAPLWDAFISSVRVGSG